MRSKKYLIFLGIIMLLTGCTDKTFIVTFNTEGGTVLESVEVNKGETLDIIETPTKEGYLFVNWLKNGIEYKNNMPVNEDFTLTANWIEAPTIADYYQVTFICNNEREKISVKENETVTPPEPKEIENYRFVGWYSGEELFDFKTKITKNISLTAKYELNLVTITYELDGGIGLAVETIPKNTTLNIPSAPFKPGYKFLKWVSGEEEFNFDTPIENNITLTAIWEKIEYVTITFDTDGGSEIEDLQLEKYSKITSVETPLKEGYTFVGWQLNEEKYSLDTPVEESITIKAIYEEIKEKITE